MSDKQKIIPLGDRILVKPMDKEDKKTKTGIIIPDTIDKEKPEQGEVIAVGEGRTTDEGKTIPLRLRVGQRVLFSKYGPDEIKVDGVEYYILREDSVLAIISK